MEGLLIAIVTGLVSGLISWGGVRVELRYLRRDIDHANARLSDLEKQLFRNPA